MIRAHDFVVLDSFHGTRYLKCQPSLCLCLPRRPSTTTESPLGRAVPLCLCSSFTIIGRYMLCQMDRLLRPFLGCLAAKPVYIHMTRSLNSLVPVVEVQMVKIRRRRVEASFRYKVPNDIMTWYVIAVLDAHVAESVKTPEARAWRLILLVSVGLLSYYHLIAQVELTLRYSLLPQIIR